MNDGFSKISEYPTFRINVEGVVENKEGKILKPTISLKGCSVKLGRKKVFLGTLLPPSSTEEIISVLREVGWLWSTRLMWKIQDEEILVKVLYQSGGGGTLECERFKLTSVTDAQLIFGDASPLKNKWTRLYCKPRKRIGSSEE